jgi:hypothetical protein
MINKYAVVGSAKEATNSKLQYSEIKKALNELGMIETTIENCDCLIFINYNKRYYEKYKKLGKNLENLVLIRLEPVAVLPIQYRKSIEQKFGLIIDPGRILKHNTESDFIGYPYKYHLNPALPNNYDPNLSNILSHSAENKIYDYANWKNRKDKIVMIAANKVSPTSNSNYKLRRRIAKQMSPGEIDVYGDLWNSSMYKRISHRVVVSFYALKTGLFPNIIEVYGSLFSRYSNYVAMPKNKHTVIQKYRFSLVIENSSDYCSEKLFDVIINGSIPIYVGPENSQIELPENLYFWCNGTVDDIRKFVKNITPEKVDAMLKSMENYIQSQSFKDNWTSDKVYFKISNKIYTYWNYK